jgi:hypothetical protein
MATKYDRAAEDMANIFGLEHVNFTIPDQRLAILFYITGMGFTRDPYLVTGVENMWVNIGRSQIHLPIGEPQVLRGRVGLLTPNLGDLGRSLKAVSGALKGTRFSYSRKKTHIDVTCPWGNQLRCHQPDEKFGPIKLGMPYVQFDVPPGTADAIAGFYRHIFDATTGVERIAGARAARVSVGYHQDLIFRESKAPLPDYDGHHFQIYVGNFSGPHAKLLERGLITQESNQHQYRFRDIVDLDSGEKIYEIEHEIRSMTHPIYGRALVNRNPAQTNNAFASGYDERPWAEPYSA